jgi:hypothetical protein
MLTKLVTVGSIVIQPERLELQYEGSLKTSVITPSGDYRDSGTRSGQVEGISD